MAQDNPLQFDPDVFSLATADKEQLNGIILFNLGYYNEIKFRRKKLWLFFSEDYQDWTVEHFKTAPNHVIKRLRDFLHLHGVFVNKQEEKITIAAALSRTVGWPQYKKWPGDVPTTFSDNNNKDKRANTSKAMALPSMVLLPPTGTTIPPIIPSSFPQPGPSMPFPTEPKGEVNFAETVRAYNLGKETSEHYALSAFGKLYDSEKLQYGGIKSMDSFDHKFLLWINHCHMARILGDTLFTIFPKMLKGAAIDYFYTNVYEDQITIAGMCYMIKRHFETDVWQQNIQTE